MNTKDKDELLLALGDALLDAMAAPDPRRRKIDGLLARLRAETETTNNQQET